MEYEYAKSFIKDVKKLPWEVKVQLQGLVDKIRLADRFEQITNVKKMKGSTNAFRIRIGDYRVGIYVEDEIVVFTRILHRRDIYQYFP